MRAKNEHPGAGYLDGLLEWLGGSNGEKIVAAVTMLCREGPRVIEFMIDEAAKPSTTPVHACRLLSLASKIGGKRGPVENRHLSLLMRHGDPAVRLKAKEVWGVLTYEKPKRTGRVSVKRAAAALWRAKVHTAMGYGSPLKRTSGSRKPIMPAGIPHLP